MKPVWIFDFDDYKRFFNAWVEAQEQKGHGEYRRLAVALNVSSTLVSQVFRGDKNLSLELTCELAEYLALTDSETDYLIRLVEYAKAGSFKLKEKLGRQLNAMQAEARRLESRMKKDMTLSEAEKSTFYSSYIYSAVRLLTDLPTMADVDDISRHLNLPKNQVQKVIEFLLENKLCVIKDNRIAMGPARTHIGSSSPLVAKHHQNWRILAWQKMIAHDENQLFFTGPMSLSKEVAEEIRKELPKVIEKILARVEPSPSQTTRCLNIDWFEF